MRLKLPYIPQYSGLIAKFVVIFPMSILAMRFCADSHIYMSKVHELLWKISKATRSRLGVVVAASLRSLDSQ